MNTKENSPYDDPEFHDWSDKMDQKDRERFLKECDELIAVEEWDERHPRDYSL
jgi:hypothetical protein